MPRKKQVLNVRVKSGKKPLTEKQAKAVKALAKREIRKNVEFKHHSYFGSISVSTSGTIVDLSAVPQGDTDISRDGDELRATSMSIRYYCAGYDDYNFMRVIIFQWHSNTTPVLADILNSTGTAGFLANYEVDKAELFKIMYDKTHLMVAGYSGQYHPSQAIYRKLYVPRPKMKFSAGSTAGTNKIYVLVLSDSGVAGHPGFQFNTKLNFYDA